MAAIKTIRAGFSPRLPGKVREGSHAYYRKGATLSARQAMADIISQYEALTKRLHAATPEILLNAMTPAFNKSQLYCPVKTRTLLESGKLEVETSEAGRTTASITYGSSVAWYAALVHELVYLNHKEPTRAKFLQSALEEELDSFIVSAAVDYAALMG